MRPEQLQPRLRRLAERLGHPPDVAEDLVQDAYLALAKGGFEGRSSAFTWLYRVVLNRHAELIRKNVLRRSRKPAPAETRITVARDEADAVRHALTRLPEEMYRVLVLRFFEDLPYRRIADILELPLGTVHSHGFHGLRKLRAILKEES